MILLVAVYAAWLVTAVVPTNVDVSWLLVVCDRLLGGEHLNTDILETNPPFSIFMYMPFMLLEKMTGLTAELWLTVSVIGLAMASLAFSIGIMTRGEPAYRLLHTHWFAAIVLFLILCLFSFDFGQREQFALIAILPWLALQCARQRKPDFAAGSSIDRIVAGLGAGVVIMVKPPHFAFALILPSLCLALQRRSVKPLFVLENLLGAVIVIVYLACIALFDRPFFSLILPFVRDIYLPVREPFLDLLLGWPETVLMISAATALIAGGLRQMHWDVRIPLLTAWGFIPAFMIMGKGWPNHAMPMVILGIWAFGVQIMRMGGLRDASLIRKAGVVLGCAAMLQIAVRSQSAAFGANSDPLAPAIASIMGAVERPTIISIGAQPQLANPLVRRVGGASVSRNSAAWAVYNIELLLKDASPERKHWLEGLRGEIIGAFASEIEDKKPDIVLYSAYPYPVWDNVVLKDTRIAAEIQHYDVIYEDPFVTVYLRKGLSRRAAAS
jgi:hypothetical protein